jgi:hypothetical protein
MIPLNKTLYLGISLRSNYGYIYYKDGVLVSLKNDYELGFRIATRKKLIVSCSKRGESFTRNNLLTEYGKAMMKLFS